MTTRASLLQRLAAGSGDIAWEEFHGQYGELIRTVAARRGLQPADCDDVVQEVLAKLTGAMPAFRYDPARGRFRGFLKTLVVHAIADRFRQNRGAAPVPVDETAHVSGDGGALDAIWEEQWRAHHVSRAMRTIEIEFGERDRLAFTQTARLGRPAADVARELSMSVDQVYQARSRILRRLREIVAQQVEEEG